MINLFSGIFGAMFGSSKKERDSRERGFDNMVDRINALREPADEYDPALVFKARAELIGEFRGSDAEFRSYQEGIRDASVLYEREFGAP